MRKLLVSASLMVALATACASAAPQTVLVEVTREVEVPITREVPYPIIETAEVPVTVEVTRVVVQEIEVEVTRQVEREVTVPVEVQVTRVVQVGRPRPGGLCDDYPYIIALLELSLGLWQAQSAAARTTAEREFAEGAIDNMPLIITNVAERMAKICGPNIATSLLPRRSMNTTEGFGVCADQWSRVGSWRPDRTTLDERVAARDYLRGIIDYCFDGFPQIPPGRFHLYELLEE